MNNFLSTFAAMVPSDDKQFKEKYLKMVSTLGKINLSKIEFTNDLCKVNYISTTFALLFDLTKYAQEVQSLVSCYQHNVLTKFVEISQTVFTILQGFNHEMIHLHSETELIKLEENSSDCKVKVIYVDSCKLVYMRYLGSKIGHIFEPYMRFLMALDVKKPAGTLKIGVTEVTKTDDIFGYIRTVRT